MKSVQAQKKWNEVQKTFSDFNVFMVWKDMILEPSHI